MYKETTFGILLKGYLLSVGRSKMWLSEQLGVSRQYVTQLVKMHVKPPSYEICVRIAQVLDLSEADRYDLFKAAAIGRLPVGDAPFYQCIGQPQFSFQVDVERSGSQDIPVFRYPITRILPPFKMKALEYIRINQAMAVDRYYGVYYKDEGVVSEKMAFRNGDIVIIDPCFEQLPSGSYVLVKTDEGVSIKRYELLLTNNSTFIQFIPYLPGTFQHIYDPIVDKDRFQIFGKVVIAIKRY